MSYREHRRIFKKSLAGQSVATQAQRILTLLAESGAAYCVLWVCGNISFQIFSACLANQHEQVAVTQRLYLPWILFRLQVIVLSLQAYASKNRSDGRGMALSVGSDFDRFFEGALPMFVVRPISSCGL